MAMKAKVSGSWKDLDPRVKINGSWKLATENWVKVNGAWKNTYYRYPLVTGGTLTSDATYYYRTFTDSTQLGQLSISRAPLTFDYVVVGAGGNANHIALSGNSVKKEWNWNCHNWQWYCDYYDCYYQYCVAGSWWYDDSYSINKYSGGAGGGGVVTGSTTYNPGNYEVYIAPQNTVSGQTGAPSALNKTIIAYGGAGTNTSLSLPTDTYLNLPYQIASGNGTNTARSGHLGRNGSANNGTSGGGRLDNYDAFNDTSYVQQYFPEDYSYAASNSNISHINGWGGGAGKEAFGALDGYKFRSSPSVTSSIVPDIVHSGSDNFSLSQYAPPSEAGNAAPSFYELATPDGNLNWFSVWDNVTWGRGVEALGLKVGGGGMNGSNARTLANSYGGGYPGKAGTAHYGWVSGGFVYSPNGAAGTGGGAGVGGTGGSGVIRIRYPRSAVGG